MLYGFVYIIFFIPILSLFSSARARWCLLKKILKTYCFLKFYSYISNLIERFVSKIVMPYEPILP